MSCFVLKSRELQLTLLPATNVIATFGKKIWCRNDREEQLPKNITRRRDIYCASTSIYRPITRMESFFSEMAILWGLLRYTTKGQKFWPYGLFKAARPKRPKKTKYGSECLELFNSARNAKIAKIFQKVPSRWSSLNLAFKGLKIGFTCWILSKQDCIKIYSWQDHSFWKMIPPYYIGSYYILHPILPKSNIST